jgi:hypothetical protein
MSLRRVPYSPDIWADLEEAVIVENIFRNFPSLTKMSDAVLMAMRSSEDIVGFSSTATCTEQRVCDIANAEGYINGWEYAAGDSSKILTPFVDAIESAVYSSSFLTSTLSKYIGATKLDSVMKWLFISNGPNTESPWHVDPIGSAAWMIQLVGEKNWYIRQDGHVMTGRLSRGDLIIVPPGLEHRVVNIDQAPMNGANPSHSNIAVSHNWIPLGHMKCMWAELGRIMTDLRHRLAHDVSLDAHEVLDELYSQYDNLLFGLLMVMIHVDEEDLLNVLCPESVIQDLRFVKNVLGVNEDPVSVRSNS